jgi:hypothetical protein
VVIDWTNARRGAAAADVALTWLLLAAAQLPLTSLRATAVRVVRAMFTRAFLRHFDRRSVRAALPAVTAWKCEDRNIRPVEADAMRRLAASQSSGGHRNATPR